MIQTMKTSMLGSLKTKIGALLIKNDLKKELKRFDTSQYGGAPLLGLNGLVLKTHGNSDSVCFYNTIVQAYEFSKHNVTEQMASAFKDLSRK